MAKQHEVRPIRQILVATGLTPESVGAVLMGQRLAELFGARLHLVHVIDPLSPDASDAMPDLASGQEAIAREELETFARGHGLREAVTLHVRRGEAETEILALRKELRADLLAMGRYGKGGAKRRLGSIAHSVVRNCTVSTLVVQPEFRGDFSKIALASDLDEDSDIELRRALDLAKTLRVHEVSLLTAYELPLGYHTVLSEEEAREKLAAAARQRAERLVRQCCGEGDARVNVVVGEGPAAQAIPRMCEEQRVDLLVIGSHYRTNRAAAVLLGRMTEKILGNVQCSVWAETTPDLQQGMVEALRHLFD